LSRPADPAEAVLRLETRVVEERSPTFAEIAAFTSPAKSTPSEDRRIRRWMILRICTFMVFAEERVGQTPEPPR
jgi:hypothetical protein